MPVAELHQLCNASSWYLFWTICNNFHGKNNHFEHTFAVTKRTASTCKCPFVNVTNHFQQSYLYFEKKSSFYDLQHSYADAAAVWSNKKNMDKQYTLEKIITNILLAITRCSVLTFSDHFIAINLTFFEKLAISWFTVYLCWCCSSMQH